MGYARKSGAFCHSQLGGFTAATVHSIKFGGVRDMLNSYGFKGELNMIKGELTMIYVFKANDKFGVPWLT